MKKLIIILLSFMIFTGCSVQKESEPVKQSDFFLNTISSISIYGMDKDDAEKIISDCFKYCREYEKKLSKTIAESEVSAINTSQGNWVSVSTDTIKLISMANEFSALSDGRFDCTIAPATALWDFNSENPTVPQKDALAEAVSHVGWQNIEIDGNKIRLADPNGSIDLGGIAKGYIGDKAREFLVEKGVTKAIIDLGGNILTINPDAENSFKIGIQKPFDLQNELMGILTVDNLSVVTSGIYERCFEENGKLYHHILNTKTGMPVENELYSVTIITKDSALADCLSTTCFVMGLEEGLALIEKTPDTEAIFINNKFEIFSTSGIGTKIDFELSETEKGE